MSAAETDADAWTVARLLAWTREYLQRNEIESPRLCAEILLAHAMRCERIHLFTRFHETPADDVRERFRELVRRAASGRPIAYLTGVKEFFSLPFEVGPEVLIPRPETEILVERTIDLVRKSGSEAPAILDLGTGNGCIAVSLARHLPKARLFAGDVSEAALGMARRNAARHGVEPRIDFRHGDLFEPWSAGPQGGSPGHPLAFDIVVCNPPYLATIGAPVDDNVRHFEPETALFAGPDGLDVIRAVVSAAPRFLSTGGHLLMEMAFDQSAAVRKLLGGPCWQSVVTYRDGAGHERVVHARRSASGSAQVA